jgi:hypothetical protein
MVSATSGHHTDIANSFRQPFSNFFILEQCLGTLRVCLEKWSDKTAYIHV